MAIAQKVAGFSLGQADILRRAMGKKKKSELDKQYADFSAGMKERGFGATAIKTLWDILVPFSDYAFNKAHSAAYGVLSYWTAYLKAHYPAEYMAALLTSVGDARDKLAIYLNECRRMGIKVLAPDVNESIGYFAAVGEDIRFGMGAVRNVGFGVVEQIRKAREEKGRFTSFHDFLRKVPAAGRQQAHGGVAHQGGRLRLARLDPASADRDPRGRRRARRQRQARRGQRTGRIRLRQPLGRAGARRRGRPGPAGVAEAGEARGGARDARAVRQRSPAGRSREPARPARQHHDRRAARSARRPATARPSRSPDSSRSVQHRTARNSGNQYGIVQVEDFGGEITVMFLGKTYQEFAPALIGDSIVVVRGRVSLRDDGMNLHAVSMFQPDTGPSLGSGPLVISVAEARATTEVISALNDVLIRHAGDNEVRLRLVRGENARMFEIPYPVAVTADLYGELKGLLGPNCLV